MKSDWRPKAAEQGLILRHYAGIVSVECEDTDMVLDTWSVKAGATGALQRLAKEYFLSTEASMF